MEVYNWLWSDSFWLPGSYTWKDLKNQPGSKIYIPQAKDINWSIPLGVLLVFVRYIFEVHIVAPIAVWLGVKDKKKSPTKPNPVLEEFYNKNGFVNNNNNIQSIAKQTDMSIREVEVWLRDRRQQSVPSKVKKFSECSWHFVFYLSAFIYGCVILWDKPWMWETKLCWLNWPNLHVTNDVYYYYLIELSFYWCLVFSVLTDHRRKDFKEMMIHHMATISLLYFSWVVNFPRIGTLVLLVHDIGDIPLAAGKMAKYCGKRKLTEGLFVIFISVWVISRLGLYPFRVLYSSIVELYTYLPPFNAFYFFNGLLVLLQILHFIWSYMIAKIAYLNLFHNKVQDVRSDTEDSEEE